METVAASMPENLSIDKARRILTGNCSVLPIGNKVLRKWYDDAKNWQDSSSTQLMSPHRLLGQNYSEPALFRDLARQIIIKCDMIARAQEPGRTNFENYIKATKNDLVDIVFKITAANQIVAPKDRLLLALGGYLQQQETAIDKKHHPLLADMKPVLEMMQEFVVKPLHRLELAYLGTIATTSLAFGTQAARAKSLRDTSHLKKQANETIISEVSTELRTLFKVDWSKHRPTRTLSKLVSQETRPLKINTSQPTER